MAGLWHCGFVHRFSDTVLLLLLLLVVLSEVDIDSILSRLDYFLTGLA